MILAVDVQYSETKAFVAGVLFSSWQDEKESSDYLAVVSDIEEYEPGSFYKRELPCILALLKKHQLKPETIVVDGYVYLDVDGKPGLGKRLYDSLDGKIKIVGVAKKAFVGINEEFGIYRGKSSKPLYVTATFCPEKARECIVSMYGENRIPVLLKRADRLCREAANKSSKRDAASGAPS